MLILQNFNLLLFLDFYVEFYQQFLLCQVFLSFYFLLKIPLISLRLQLNGMTVEWSKKYSFPGNRTHIFCFLVSCAITILDRSACAFCVSPLYVRCSPSYITILISKEPQYRSTEKKNLCNINLLVSNSYKRFAFIKFYLN